MANLESIGETSPAQSFNHKPNRVGLSIPRRYVVTGGFILVALIAFLLVWEWLAINKQISVILFPPPSLIFQRFVKWLENGFLWEQTWITLRRLVIGLTWGTVVGVAIGFGMGYFRVVRGIVDPVIAILHPVPKITILPLLLVFFGLGEAPYTLLVGVAAFFPMVINTTSGVRQISNTYFEVAQVYELDSLSVFRKIVFFGSLPMILTGFRLAFNVALTIVVVLELTIGPDGLGSINWSAWQTLRLEDLYISIVLIALIGLVTNLLFQWLTPKITHWVS